MEISQIEKLIYSIAERANYSAVIASEEQVEREITSYPTAWIQLPKVLYVEGRGEGIIGHKIAITLLDDYNGHSIEDKQNRLAKMQEEALEMMTQLSLEEGVVEVDALTVTPRIVRTTRHGDIAQLCEATIVTYF